MVYKSLDFPGTAQRPRPHFHCGKYEIGGEELVRVVLIVIQLCHCTSNKGYMQIEDFRCISVVLGMDYYKSVKLGTDTATTLWLLLAH